MSLTELFRSHVTAHPGAEALVMVSDTGSSSLTYGELDARAAAVAGQLLRTCLPGDRVLLLHPSGPEFVAAYLGCLYAGVIAVPAPFPGRRENRQERRRLTGMVANAGVSLVLSSRREVGTVAEWLTEEGLDGLRCEASDDPGGPAVHQVFGAQDDTIAFLQYTSGSTGEPKGVVLTHGNLTSNIAGMAQMLDVPTSRLRVCSWLPLHHDMGLIGTVLYPLAHGGTAVLLDPSAFLRKPFLWLSTMDRFRANVTAAPSFAYAQCTERVTDAQLAALDLSHVERLGNGAEKIDPAVMKDFLDRFAPTGLRRTVFGPSYGLAEATLAVAVKAGHDPDVEHSSVSCGAAPFFDLRVVDPVTHEVLGSDREGEIWLSGPSVSSGYWQREDDTRTTFGNFTADGDGPFLRTGDLGVLIEGEVHVNGRIKDVIVVNGQKIFPPDVEHELRAQHPELTGVGAVFTVPAAGGRKQLPVVIVHEVLEDAGGLPALAQDVLHTAAKEFSVAVDSVVFVRPGSIPRTSSNKVNRPEARALHLAGALDPIYGWKP
ncbi:fatty acyl-AMP ligase [Amycolatopsis speibonae]|uniref:Fatty acyl-AMP ligase n=1 Tax=Amycolatopsis speibonae TaxID=1450224 RepID=A0ABV7PF31_9PSEU